MAKKRFYRLCGGPLAGRTLCPGSAEYPRVTREHGGARLSFAVPAARGDDAAAPARAADASLVHVYEVFDLADEISLEILLCKYLGTCPAYATLPNAAAA